MILVMSKQSLTQETNEFQKLLKTQLFIVSTTGFLMYTVLLIYYTTYINIKKVDKVSKFIIGVLFAYNISNLASTTVSFFQQNDHIALLIIDLIIFYMIVGIQFKFLYEMREVYLKITSDDAKTFFENMKKIKPIQIIFYVLSVIAFIV